MKRVKARCDVCNGTADVQYAPRPGQIPGAATASRYICASCLYLEDHPDAARIAPQPRRSKKDRPQVESLLAGEHDTPA